MRLALLIWLVRRLAVGRGIFFGAEEHEGRVIVTVWVVDQGSRHLLFAVPMDDPAAVRELGRNLTVATRPQG